MLFAMRKTVARAGLFAVAFGVVCSFAFAQSGPHNPAASSDPDRTCDSVYPANDPASGISFDVVSVRPVEESHNGALADPPNGDGIDSANGTLEDVLRWNFNLGNGWRIDQFQGIPKGFRTDNYDIHAKVGDSQVAAWQKLDDAARRRVFRKLLFERFHLTCHFMNEERPVYDLVVVNSGKLHPSTPEDLKPFEGKGAFPGTFGVKVYVLSKFQFGFPEIPMELFADNFLTRQSGRTVIDKTGLSGKYTFTLTFKGIYASAAADEDLSAPAVPSLFTALQEQIGLKLEPAKGPVPVLVIDHVELPSEN